MSRICGTSWVPAIRNPTTIKQLFCSTCHGVLSNGGFSFCGEIRRAYATLMCSAIQGVVVDAGSIPPSEKVLDKIYTIIAEVSLGLMAFKKCSGSRLPLLSIGGSISCR